MFEKYFYFYCFEYSQEVTNLLYLISNSLQTEIKVKPFQEALLLASTNWYHII